MTDKATVPRTLPAPIVTDGSGTILLLATLAATVTDEVGVSGTVETQGLHVRVRVTVDETYVVEDIDLEPLVHDWVQQIITQQRSKG